ncbi:hypothetical protein ELUCI_v1c00140 [Williamsoniiplasma lucivorax]|uniref:Uncharacterized protein n=2 Tax=Williamsoniiplasma lucivorax TaxID=209274 RepID=A0A2S5REL2_9MOLU|nr:hypothetical protein ELUCI_v1c00140 [Williamsoniiplasma lucivorax]
MKATSEFNQSGTVKIVSELKEMILVARELAKEPFMPHEIYIKLQDVIYNAQQVVDNNSDNKQMVVRALDQLESKIDEINKFMLDETLYVLNTGLQNAQDALKQQGASNEARTNLVKVIEEVEIFINEEPVDFAEVNTMITKIMKATSEFNQSGTVKILAKLDQMISQAVMLIKAGESTIDQPTLEAFKAIVIKAQAVVKNHLTDAKILQEMFDELEDAMYAFPDSTFEEEN